MQFSSFFTESIPLKNASRQSGQTLIFFCVAHPATVSFRGRGHRFGLVLSERVAVAKRSGRGSPRGSKIFA